jgi:hypothetical protein
VRGQLQIPCSRPGCPDLSALAVRTTSPAKGSLRTQVFWDPDDASGTAEHLCSAHGGELLASLWQSFGGRQ